MEGVRNEQKSVKERAYQESLCGGKYEVLRGGDVENEEKEWEKSEGVYQ